MYFEKKTAPKKFDNFLIVRIHVNIKLSPDFAARPRNCPSVPNVCELIEMSSQILQILIKTMMHFV